MSGEADLDRVVVDFGNPIMGVLYDALLIAGTVGSYPVWDNLGAVSIRNSIILADHSTRRPTPSEVALTQER